MRTLLAFVATLLCAASAPDAQQVTFHGKVEDVQGTANQFRVDCTSTALTSSTINLNAFIGVTAELTGQWNGSFGSPSVEVTSLSVLAENFEIAGGAKIGRTSELSFIGNPDELAIGILSTEPAFIRFRRANGVIFIRLNSQILQLSGTIGQTGILSLPFDIPDDPMLVGLEMFGQAAFLGNGVRMSNPDCKTISD